MREEPAGLRILIGADTFDPDVNGTAVFTRELAVRLSRHGHTVHIVAPSGSMHTRTEIEVIEGERLLVHRVRSVRWPLHDTMRVADPLEARHVVGRIVEHVHPDVVHVQSVLNIGHAVLVSARARGIPVVATNHIMPENLMAYSGLPGRLQPVLTRAGWRYVARALERAQTITSPTPAAARYLENHAANVQVLPLSCGVDLDRFRFRPDRPEGDRILFVGRLDPEKNVGTLLAAFAQLPPSIPAGLDIVGEGAMRPELERRARELGVADRVVFHGHVSDAELVEHYRRAVVFVMPSVAELQSIASLEALSTGVPLVVADAMALPHLVEEGRNGYVVAPHDASAFAAAIADVLTRSPEDSELMREAARLHAEDHDQDVVVRRFEQLYRQAMADAERISA